MPAEEEAKERLGDDFKFPEWKWRLNRVDSCSTNSLADQGNQEIEGAEDGGYDDEEGGAGGGGGGGGGDGADDEPRPDIPEAGKPPWQPQLHELVVMDRLKQVAKALDKGEGVNQQDCLGETPLFWAVSGEMVDHLIAEGANIEWRNSLCNCSALYKFACQGKLKPLKAIGKHLKEAGLLDEFVNEASSHTSRTPLHAAAHNGFTQVVMELLAMGADKTLQDYVDKTALDLAKKRGFDEIVDLLE